MENLLIGRTITQRCVHSNTENGIRCPSGVASNDIGIVSPLCVRVVVQRCSRYFTLQIGCVNELWKIDTFMDINKNEYGHIVVKFTLNISWFFMLTLTTENGLSNSVELTPGRDICFLIMNGNSSPLSVENPSLWNSATIMCLIRNIVFLTYTFSNKKINTILIAN